MTTEKRIVNQLCEIRALSLPAYINLLQNISAIHSKLLVAEAENIFYKFYASAPNIYELDENAYPLIAQYFNIDKLEINDVHIVFIEDIFLALFISHTQSHAVQRIDVYGKEDVTSFSDIFSVYVIDNINREHLSYNGDEMNYAT